MPQCVQNTFKNDLYRWPQMVSAVQLIGGENQLTYPCVLVALRQRSNPFYIWQNFVEIWVEWGGGGGGGRQEYLLPGKWNQPERFRYYVRNSSEAGGGTRCDT